MSGRSTGAKKGGRAVTAAAARSARVRTDDKRNDTQGRTIFDVLGLSWVVDLVIGTAAAGIVAADYGASMARRQWELLSAAQKAVLEARRRFMTTSSSDESSAALAQLSEILVQQMSRLVDLLGIATPADFSGIETQLDALESRIGKIERKRKRGGAPTKSAAQTAEGSATKALGRSGAPRMPIRAAVAAVLSETAAPAPGDSQASAPSSSTMFIGSVPGSAAIEKPPARATSISPEPDAMRFYLAADADELEPPTGLRRRKNRPDR